MNFKALLRFQAAVARGETPAEEDIRAVAVGLERMKYGASFAQAFGKKKPGPKPQRFFDVHKLRAVYLARSGDVEAVAMELGVDERTVRRYLRKYAKTLGVAGDREILQLLGLTYLEQYRESAPTLLQKLELGSAELPISILASKVKPDGDDPATRQRFLNAFERAIREYLQRLASRA